MAANNVPPNKIAANSANVEAMVFAKLAQWSVMCNLPRDGTIAVAFSGGGDSTALLSLLLKWTDGADIYAFIIDHGLRAGSGDEAKLARRCAINIGARAEVLTALWPDGIPTTGIQEKARNARYQLLAQACDKLQVDTLSLFLGHNEDDQAETVLMRQDAGSGWRGLAGIAGRALFPVCPTVSGVQVLRPLLSCTRAELRNYNRKNGLKWIDDPSNENRSFARIRARENLKNNAEERELLLLTSAAACDVLQSERGMLTEFIRANTELYTWGGVALMRSFHNTKFGQTAEALKYIIQAIAGQGSSPNVAKRLNLARQLRWTNFKGATLGGVRFFAAHGDVYCVRDLGALTGRNQISPLSPLVLNAGAKRIWDARYGVATKHGVTVEALAKWLDHLTKQQREALQYIPQPARGGLPVFTRNDQVVFVPFLEHLKSKTSETSDYWVQSLITHRLYALLSE